MLASALVVVLLHLYAASAWHAFAEQDQRALQLALRSSAALPALDVAATRRATLSGLRAQMRDIAGVSGDENVRSAAQAVALLTYEYETTRAARAAAPPPLAPLLDELAVQATGASAQAHAHAVLAGRVALLAVVLLPVLAAAGALVLASGITRSIDGTLRDCIAFAGEIAAGNFSHGSSQARPAASARRLDADADSASEFDILVRSMNRIADETVTAAERTAAQTARLERVERSWALLSACSKSLAKAGSETELLNAICGHLAELGGYRVAWVGYACDDESMTIEVAAHAGTDADYVNGLQLSWGADVHKQGGFGTAIHQVRTVATSQLASDLVFTCWRELTPPHGLASALALPLMSDGEGDGERTAFGVLGLYSEQSGPVEEEELQLLHDLADDLAFGIVSRRQSGQRQRAEAQLARHVNYDDLTGLAKLETLQAQLLQLAEQARAGRKTLAALHVDLDRFKDVNDTLGRAVGDQVLAQAALRLVHCAGEGAVLARPGADEFVILLPGLAAPGDAAKAASRMAAQLAEPLAAGLLPPGAPAIRPLGSIGISLYPDDSAEIGDLLRNAGLAMQEAKRQGGNTCRYYAPELNARMASRFVMESELSRALERGELSMHYQPQCSLQTGVVVGAEALMRWKHPTRGMVAPGEFIKLAEETGLVLPIGAWAIENVCGQLKAWRDAGVKSPPVAVNLSARQFQQAGLVQTVRRALESSGVVGRQLVLELTESAVMQDVEAAIVTLRELKELGVGIALDDFGTGYSSLSHLKRFTIDHLKIDHSFVRDITTSPDDAAICNAVIGLAHNLRVQVVAEGVETVEQMNYLRRRYCDSMQGYLFSKAVPAGAYAQLLASGNKLALPDAAETPPTLLLLDDEPNIIRSLNRALRLDGYKILAATSASDALKLLAMSPVQVVLSDHRMPEMTGIEFLSRVKDLYPDTVRIILSGYADLDSVIDAINRGAVYRYFTKPWDDEQLRDCVQQAFRHQQLLAA
ncbi:EAL domain-containing protein [Pseudoduganella aquatica]|uniref:EAL domain-containing protein n=1 Tax=Pseudoduganella aquatica TaxID=2660641 RepID=UPI001E31B28C|nr:EAL domain-containing protein [Pseudoduganella aquatica]